MKRKNRHRKQTSAVAPTLQRTNLAVARAVIKAMNHPASRHRSDRALGRKLGLDHKTIGRWRKKLNGGEVPQELLTKGKFLSLCRRLTAVLPDKMWSELNKPESIEVHQAYRVLHHVLFGEKTLPVVRPKLIAADPASKSTRIGVQSPRATKADLRKVVRNRRAL